MNNNWKEALHFSQRERRGIFIFVSIIGIFLCLPPLIEKYFQSSQVDFTDFKLAIKEYEANQSISSNNDIPTATPHASINPNTASLESLLSLGITEPIAQRIIKYRNAGGAFVRKEDLKKIYGLKESLYQDVQKYIHIPPNTIIKKNKYPVKKVARQQQIKAFKFDPNTASSQELISMGLPSKVVNQLVNYRSKGGSFKRKEDLKKIYALSDQQYQQLAPFIILQKPSLPAPKSPSSYTTPSTKIISKNIQIDINIASIEEWQQLRGIGPYYAKKIVDFREKLGGFYSIDQVGTTYGLPDSVFQKIHTQLVATPLKNSLVLNTISIEELTAHPYIKKHQAIAIVNYRRNHGPFDSIEKIKRVKVFSEKDLERIIPYLSLN